MGRSKDGMARLALLGLPQDDNSTFLRGPRLAPPLIRTALVSPSANMFAETGMDLGAEALWRDAGDLPLSGLTGQDAHDAIHDGVAAILARGQAVISLGGDHSVSWPAVRAHAAQYPGLTILHLDAHPDLYDSMEDNPFSHASPFARIMESGCVARLVQVGIRTLNDHQRAQVARFGVECHEMRHNIDMANIRASLGIDGPVYLSIDLDVLDPAFAPGVSHHEPGGMSVRDVLHIIQNFGGQLIGGDLVELNPDRDLNGVTAMVAAKILREMMARCLADHAAEDGATVDGAGG